MYIPNQVVGTWISIRLQGKLSQTFRYFYKVYAILSDYTPIHLNEQGVTKLTSIWLKFRSAMAGYH